MTTVAATGAAVERCVQCRFDGGEYTLTDLRGTIRSLPYRWRWLFEGVAPSVLAARPEPATWSSAEYCSHVADVLEAHGRLLHAMTTVDGLGPLAPPDRADAAPGDPPLAVSPESVLARLEANAARYDGLVGRTPPEALARTVTVGDDTFDALWLVRHTVHDASHHLSDAGRVLARVGAGAPPQRGSVGGLFVSGGGVPKAPVESADVGYRGLAGDRQASRRHHGRVWQALCLWSAEVVAALAAEGHPVRPGAAGENVSVAGVEWRTIRPGVRLQIGDVLCEVSSYSPPCQKNAQWFASRDFGRIDHDRHPGTSRVYASVLVDGRVRVGDPVIVEPGPP